MVKLLMVGLSCLMLGFGASAKSAPPPLFLGVKTDKQVYKPQEPIAMALTVLNPGGSPQRVSLASSQQFDFLLYQEEKVIWRWSADKLFAQALSSLTLEPGLPVTYLVKFDQKLASGDYLPPGRYQLVGVLASKEKPSSQPVDIEILK
jgi:hypothetical protein